MTLELQPKWLKVAVTLRCDVYLDGCLRPVAGFIFGNPPQSYHYPSCVECAATFLSTRSNWKAVQFSDESVEAYMLQQVELLHDS